MFDRGVSRCSRVSLRAWYYSTFYLLFHTGSLSLPLIVVFWCFVFVATVAIFMRSFFLVSWEIHFLACVCLNLCVCLWAACQSIVVALPLRSTGVKLDGLFCFPVLQGCCFLEVILLTFFFFCFWLAVAANFRVEGSFLILPGFYPISSTLRGSQFNSVLSVFSCFVIC